MGQKTLPRILFITFLALLSFASATSVKATHYAAADLYLDYIGNGPTNLKYQITLVVYKACEPNNASLVTSEPVTFSSSCGSLPSRNLPSVVGPDTMDQLCANFAPVNACRLPGSVWPAFVRRIYRDTVTFPTACSDWTVAWSGCDRNYQILNIETQTPVQCIRIEAGINNVVKYNNNTPRFIIDPIPYLCQNQPAFFLNGPLDPDNDSMVTVNVQPLGNAGPIPYKVGYNLLNPVATPAANPYTVNPNTGTASFIPTGVGRYVLAFECTDYDRFNGTPLSYVRRDVQVSVVSCSAAPPFIDTIPQDMIGGGWVPTPPSGGYILACPGVELSFKISGLSNTISNSVYLTSTNLTVAPGSVFAVTAQGGSNPVGQFTWTPTGNDIGDYTIIFTAKDSTCDNNQPIVLKNYFVAFIKVLAGVDAGPDGRICELGGTPWQFNVNGPPSAKYVWTALDGSAPLGLSNDTIPNPTAYPPYNFTYVVTAPNIITACKNKDTVQVYIDTSNAVVASPHEYVLCRPGYFTLDAQGIGLPPLENLECGTFDIKNCTTEDVLVVSSQYSGGTPIQSNVFTPFPAGRTGRMQFLLTKPDLFAYGVRAGTIRGIAFDVVGPPTPAGYTYNNFTISLKCTDRRTLSAATGGMENGMTLVYTAPAGVPVAMGWNQFTFDTPYSLDSTKSLIIEICYNNTTPATTGATVNAVNTNSQQMIYTFANNGNASICENPAIAASTTYTNARPNIRINYCPADTVPFPYTWYPGDYLSDSTVKSPLVYVGQSTKYLVTTIGRNGCKVVDSIDITVPIHNYDVWPKDTTICVGSSFKMIASGDFTQVKWYETDSYNAATSLDCDNCKEPIATPLVNTRYYVVMTDKDGCSDTMIVNSEVRAVPDVQIINRDTVLKYGQSIQLLASGAFLYSWNPISTLSNPNIVNPVATPTEPTTYHVFGLAENGCRNEDSIRINIDYRDNLYVPSAFTPNGDGKNDVFRVSNITFQKLQEFRVFNRWGQEIFSTTDANKGWDGSWKGVPQDMGSYQYLVRVAYPDGYIETYKGNVTLIR